MTAAFLVSQYPAISHTFVLREITGLRARGLQIESASINEPDRPYQNLSAAEQAEAHRTFYVKQKGWVGALHAHLATLFFFPSGYGKGLLAAARLAWSNPRHLGYSFFYFTEALILGQWMQRRNLNHLHVHFATAASTVGLLTAKSFGFGYSLTVHGPDEFYDVRHYQLEAKFRAASFISCIGHYAKSQVMRLTRPEDWDKIDVIPLGVDPEAFRPFRKRLHSATLELLCVGRLVSTKGQTIVVEAVRLLSERGHEVRLLLVGEGPDRTKLLQQISAARLEKSIVLEGAINPDRIRQYLQRTDIFVLASFAEGIPVALMEAMAMEVPCISTFVNGIPELIESGVDGLLIRPADAVALADAIQQLCADPLLRARLGAAGRRKVMERYHLGRNHELAAKAFRARLSRPPLLREGKAECTFC